MASSEGQTFRRPGDREELDGAYHFHSLPAQRYDGDHEGPAKRAMDAMKTMKKIDIAAIEAAVTRKS